MLHITESKEKLSGFFSPRELKKFYVLKVHVVIAPEFVYR